MVQSGLVSEPWKELLELTAGLPQKTQEEVIAGKMALLRHNLEEKYGSEKWKKMLNWGSMKVHIDGFTGDADASALFRLQEFVSLNERLQTELERWNITTLNCAAIPEHGIARTKAVVGPDNSVEFEEPLADFPSEQLMTQLRMIAPDKKAKVR